MDYPLTYVWLAAFVAALVTSAYAYARLRGHPARSLAVFPAAAAGFWALSAALANGATTPAQIATVDRWMSWSWAFLPYAVLVGTIRYAGDAAWLTTPRRLALAIPALGALALGLGGHVHTGYVPAGRGGLSYVRSAPTGWMSAVLGYLVLYLSASVVWLARHVRLATRGYVRAAMWRLLVPAGSLVVLAVVSHLLPPSAPAPPMLTSLVATAGFTALSVLTIRAHGLIPVLDTAQAVRAAMRQLQHFLSILPDAGVLVDSAGRVLVANQPAADLVGELTPAGLASSDTPALHYVEPADRKYVLLSLEQLRRGVPLRGLRARILRPDGASTPVDVSALAASRGLGDDYYIVTLRDVSAYERAVDEQAIQRERAERAKRSESLAALAGGLTHDLNNLLAVIRGNLELLREDAGQAVEQLPYIDRAATAISRAAGLTDDLLAYLGQRPPSGGTASLTALVTDAVATYSPPGAATADITVRHEGPSPQVAISAKDVRRIVGSLLDNAVEATPVGEGQEGLLVTVTEKEHHRDAGVSDTVSGLPIPAGRYGVVVVSDRGPGIPGDRVDRIFDPFVTTKRTGRGLGLSIVLGLVRARGGYLRVDSEPGRGTAVTVFLPSAQRSAASGLAHEQPLRLVR